MYEKKKHSLCTWMVLRGCLKTKEFHLERNVNCGSCCVLCDCTWESSKNLFLHCPYDKLIWRGIVNKFWLQEIDCATPFDLIDSIRSRNYISSRGLDILTKLIFPSFDWHLWREMQGYLSRFLNDEFRCCMGYFISCIVELPILTWIFLILL